MTCEQITGNSIKGTAIATSEAEAQEFATEKREIGLQVRLRRKYETFLGDRMQVNPPIIRIYFEP